MNQDPIPWNTQGVKPRRADAFQAHGTREEIRLLFGTLSRDTGRKGQFTAGAHTRVVLSPFTAKGLARALERILEQATPAGEEVPPQAAAHVSPNGSLIPNEQEKLIRLVQDLGVDFGVERSFKMAPGRLLPDRLLLAVNTRDAAPERLVQICREIGMPVEQGRLFRERLDEADTVGLGIEQSYKTATYKVYLEFWEKVKKLVGSNPDRREPLLLHLGFKWDAHDPQKAAMARYMTHPMLSTPGILKRVASILQGPGARVSLETARAVIRLAARRARNQRFIYLEVGEQGNPRRSFDVNLYKAALPLKELHPLLSGVRRAFGIPKDGFEAMFEQAGERIFGHLSAGVDRQDKDFWTISYEIRARPGV